jgi:hypothetical protein
MASAARAGLAGGLTEAVSEAGRHLAAIARLEVELARAETTRKARSLGAAAAVFGVAAVIVLFALGFALAAAASALDHVLPLWLSLLVVAGGLLLVGAVCALVGRRLVRRGMPPVPEHAIAEAKATMRTVQNGHGAGATT